MATNKEVIEFIRTLYPAALHNWITDKENSLHPVFVTAQAGLETGWKIKGIGNNILGITKGSSWTGPVKLVTTTEYFQDPDKKFTLPEEVLKKEYRPANKDYKYIVNRFFRVYDSIGDCLKDHGKVMRNKNFVFAWDQRESPRVYVKLIAPKYATATNYADIMMGCISTVERTVKNLGL